MKTMTTQESLLALATRTHPDAPWYLDELHGIVYDERDGTQFDPANNSEQAMEVLCWLLPNPDYERWSVCLDGTGGHIRGTDVAPIADTASLRAAIVQAACRVVQS